MPPRRRFLLNLALAAAYVATGRLGLQLAGYADSVTLVWPPAGIALAALALYGRGVWPGIALGAFAVNLPDLPAPVALGIALGNTLGALAGHALLEWGGVEPPLRRARDAAGLFAAVVAFPLVSASVGVASLELGGVLRSEQAFGAWLWWCVGDGAGVLLLAPVLLTWLSPRPRALPARSRLEALALAAVLAASAAGVFLGALPGETVPLTFAVMPPLAWASARFGPRGAALAALATAAIAVAGTLAPAGAFAGYPLQQRILFLEVLVSALGAMALLLAAEVSEREEAFEALAASVGARVRAERELELREQRFRLLSDSALDVISDFDADGRVLYLSPNLPSVLGAAAEGLAGRCSRSLLEEIVHPDDLPGLAEQVERVLVRRGARFSAAFRARHGRGDWIWLESHAHSFEAGDGTLHVVSVSRDVTERVRAEAEARRLTEQLLQTQKLESLGVLAGGIAHDFNNLLAGILANGAWALSSLPPDSPLRPALCGVETLATRAAELTHQLLAYAGGAPLVTRDVDLSALVAEMDVLLEASLPKKARSSFDLEPGLPLVEADPAEIRQVVMNLVANASEALGEDGGYVHVATRRGEPGPDGAACVELEVRDTGCGMDEETRARMFDPFFTTKFAGRGLGLAATLGIARRHRASLEVETAVGRGTAVVLRFAASPRRASEAPVETRPAWTPGGAVLVVDDEAELRAAVARALGGAGFTVLSASDGVEALDVFRRHAGQLRAVLLDLTMPDLSGAEVLSALRALHPDVPVVVWSGHTEAEIAARLRGEKPDAVLLKPSTLSELLAGLQSAIERR
jgi:PAS domain S-box-containing protein